MEPAPAQAPVITMPDPHRVVTRSITMLARKGFTRNEACLAIRKAAWTAWVALAGAGIDQLEWLAAISREAHRREGFTTSPITDTVEAHHGDETRSGRSYDW